MILLLAFPLSLCLLLLSRYSPLKILDAPNERSMHDIPTPRTGGVAMILAVLTAWTVQVLSHGMTDMMVWIVISALLVGGISFIDDLRELSPLVRIVVHALAAIVLIAGGMVIFDGVIGIVFTWLAIVWMLNLYNFMDGMDGLASGTTLFGFVFLACAGWLQGADEYATLAALVAVAALGFLCVNFPPAKIFMGDIGSATLGLLTAVFSLWGIKRGLFEPWFPLLVFSPFVVDATVTLMRRMMNRERVWEAHRSHYYQRLVTLGWGHKTTVLAEYMLMFLVGLTAFGALLIQAPIFTYSILFVWCGCYVFMMYRIHHLEAGVE